MAWDPLGDDEYSGDLPMDAFGGALAAAAEAHRKTAKRLPFAAELADAFLAAIRDEPALDAARAEGELARWIALPRVPTKGKRPRAKSGDVIAIPFAGDGARRVLGRVLFAPTKDVPGPGYGLCIVVHDLEWPADPAAIAAAPRLLGPCHASDEPILEGRWEIVGNVPVAPDELPTFAVRYPNGKGGWRDAVTDYFGAELADSPANRARVIPQSTGGATVQVIRMLKGLVRWMPSYAEGFDLRRPS